jgi:hypothetical protein
MKHVRVRRSPVGATILGVFSTIEATRRAVPARDDEARQLALGSFIEPGGEHVHVIVRAASPGQAIAVAQSYREWLLEHHSWTAEARPLEVLDAGGPWLSQECTP